MVDVDKKTPESDGKFCPTGEAVLELSSSLNYMLLAAKLACAIDGSEADINSKDKCRKDAGPSFSGFQDNIAASEDQPNETQKTFVLSQVDKNKDQNKHVQMDIDINMPLFENEDIERNGKGIQDNLHPLDIAREKYFFVDDSTPSYRILDDFDDCGNEILKPELWRPLGMDTKTYNAKIEEAKKSGPANTSMQDEQTTQGDLSIHCAQKIPTSTELCKYRDFLPGFKENDGIIDLTSHVAHMSTTWNRAKTCYSPMREWNNENTNSSSQQHNKIFSTPPILGKRLFTDEYNEGHEEQGTEKQPIPVRDDLQLQLSPEVQILGESSFNGSCSNMVNTADKLYNTKLTIGTSSSGKENLPPKRVIYPSRFLCSPYDHNDRGPLMSHEKQLYSSIITLSKVEPHRSSWVVLVDKTSLSLGQLDDSFDTNGWVEAYVFNVYCRMLFRDNHPGQSKRHYFFTTIGDYLLEKWANEEGRRSMRRRALISFDGAGKALPLHESDRLFFPSVHDHHWFLFVVDLAARKFLFLDSVYDGDTPFHLEIKDLMIKNFIKTWEESNVRRMGFKHFGVDYPNLPKQTGRDACGIFVLKRMQNWASRNPLQPQFKMKDVADARVRFAVDILFSPHNTIDEGKKLVKNF